MKKSIIAVVLMVLLMPIVFADNGEYGIPIDKTKGIGSIKDSLPYIEQNVFSGSNSHLCNLDKELRCKLSKKQIRIRFNELNYNVRELYHTKNRYIYGLYLSKDNSLIKTFVLDKFRVLYKEKLL